MHEKSEECQGKLSTRICIFAHSSTWLLAMLHFGSHELCYTEAGYALDTYFHLYEFSSFVASLFSHSLQHAEDGYAFLQWRRLFMTPQSIALYGNTYWTGLLLKSSAFALTKDSGPGSACKSGLAHLRSRYFYLFPSHIKVYQGRWEKSNVNVVSF